MRFKSEKTELVELQKRSVTFNDFNEEVESWAKEADMYAEFLERHGKEGESDGQILVVQDVRCKVRYRDQLDPDIDNNTPERDFRIKRGTEVYDVQSITKEGRRKTLMIMLERRDNE